MTDLTAVNASAVTEAATLADDDFVLSAVGGVTRKTGLNAIAAWLQIDSGSAADALASAASAAASAAAAGAAAGRLDVGSFAQLSSKFNYTGTGGRQIAAEGDVVLWRGAGIAYEVQATGSITYDFDYTGSGGIKLSVLPSADGSWPLEAWGAPLNGTDNDTTYLKAAIDAKKVAGIVDAPPTITVGYGKTLRLATSCAIDGGSVRLVGYGANIQFASNYALDIGAAVYLTDIAQGNHTFILEGFTGTGSSGNTSIRNRGYRKLWIDSVYCVGGKHFLETEGAFAGSGMRRCRIQSTTDRTVQIKQRNNNWTFENNTITGAGAPGISLSTVSAELKGIQFVGRNDVEGCAGGILVDDGLIAIVSIDGVWFENNTAYNIRITNTSGSSSKDAITITRCNISGAGVDVQIGTDASGTLIHGVVIEGNEFADSDLILIGGDKIKDLLIGANRFSGTGVITMPAATSMFTDAYSLPPARVMPLHFTLPAQPFGTSDTKGILGEYRWGPGVLWVKTQEGWGTIQIGQVGSTTVATLPTGATPSVLGQHKVYTGNGSATSVTSFSNGAIGQELVIIGGDGGNTTIAHGTNIRLAGGANFVLGDNDVIVLVCQNGTKWSEVSRSNNN
jgi:hypothetical protein